MNPHAPDWKPRLPLKLHELPDVPMSLIVDADNKTVSKQLLIDLYQAALIDSVMAAEDTLRTTDAGSWLPLLEMFSEKDVLLHGAAGEDAMNVGDVVALVRALARLQAMYAAATEIQGDAEVMRYVTSGNDIPVTRCTVSADLIRQLVAGRRT